MTIKMELREKQITDREVEFFIKGNVSLDKSTTPPPAPWITIQVNIILFYYIIYMLYNF